MRHPLSIPLLTLSLAAFAAPVCFAAPVTITNPSACPVELSAAQRGLGNLIPTNETSVSPDGSKAIAAGAGRRTGPAQQSFDLSIKNTRLQRIVAAELQIHGTANRSRMMNIGAVALTDKPAADAVRNVHLVSSVPADQTRMKTVSVNDLTSVAWIAVIELRYADGSTWHAHPGAACQVVPDGMMLIADK